MCPFASYCVIKVPHCFLDLESPSFLSTSHSNFFSQSQFFFWFFFFLHSQCWWWFFFLPHPSDAKPGTVWRSLQRSQHQFFFCIPWSPLWKKVSRPAGLSTHPPALEWFSDCFSNFSPPHLFLIQFLFIASFYHLPHFFRFVFLDKTIKKVWSPAFRALSSTRPPCSCGCYDWGNTTSLFFFFFLLAFPPDFPNNTPC